MSKYNFLTETELCYYCKVENLNKLKKIEEFIPLSHYLEDTEVLPAYFNVIGYIKEKAVIID